MKSVLSEKSSVFKNMFAIDMEEAASQSVDIIDFSGAVMRELLRFIYFGNVRRLKQINIELYKAAHVYDIEDLHKICLASIQASLSRDNVLDVVLFADVYSHQDLFEECCEMISR